jgi:glycosyltransferase involved in cell wall biosynthesis
MVENREHTMSNKEQDEEPLIRVLEIAGNAIVGGMETYVYNLSKHLPKDRFKITCLTPYESPFTSSLRKLGSDLFVTAMGDEPAWQSIQFTTELIHQLRIDLIHAHLPRAHMLAGLAGRLTNIPVVATIHGMEITSHELGICRLTGSYLTVVCRQALSQALAVGVPEERISLIPNGVDTRMFQPNDEGTRLRKKAGIPKKAPVVGYVGRLAWEKGPDQFIQMAEHIHKIRPDVHFMIVGEGYMEKEIDELVESSNLGGFVHRTGVLEDTLQVYSSMDVLCLPSRVEGMPTAVLEAMACGVPVAAMAVGGVAEIIEVGTTGYLSASGDWAGLGDAVIKLFSNPERKNLMGQAARSRVEKLFDLRQTVQLTANLFRRLVADNPRRIPVFNPSWPIESRSWDPALLQAPASLGKRK